MYLKLGSYKNLTNHSARARIFSDIEMRRLWQLCRETFIEKETIMKKNGIFSVVGMLVPKDLRPVVRANPAVLDQIADA
jgi:hypothetical protein